MAETVFSADGFNTAEIVESAISKSIVNDRMEYMDGWIEFVDYTESVSKMLEAQSDTVIEDGSAREYSGKDKEGHRWRVHLDLAADYADSTDPEQKSKAIVSPPRSAESA